jgi:hypothetical protein
MRLLLGRDIVVIIIVIAVVIRSLCSLAGVITFAYIRGRCSRAGRARGGCGSLVVTASSREQQSANQHESAQALLLTIVFTSQLETLADV